MKNNEKTNSKTIATNRRAKFDYFLEDEIEAGLVLVGSEVKSLRDSRASLAQSFISIDKRGEAWLEGSTIAGYSFANSFKHDSARKRKLLLHKRQLEKLSQKLSVKGYTLVPLRLYFNDEGIVKLAFAPGQGKKEFDKRRVIREEEDKREAQRAMRLKNLKRTVRA
ncbi:MAG: SsrA-binding protein SmpB [Aeriscardovia sp.]|nr:SsrA-binding protein SmpB [Aeriscardovia sp.]